MIFVGDIAVSEPKYSRQLDEVFSRHEHIFRGKELICNLEGLIMDDIDTNHKTPVLFNHSSVVPVLKKWNTRVAGLANNHTLDLPQYFKSTKTLLNNSQIGSPGAGLSKQEADQPSIIQTGGKTLIVFNHCWHVMLQHQKNPSQGVSVSTINETRILNAVKHYKSQYPEASIAVFMHWSFDLETLPFPLYRQFSRALIDAGANIVAGCHSHCVQGGEAYKNGYIVYGLGNFFVPWYTFIKGTIHFPDFARVEMALEWDIESNKAFCHWFKYTSNQGQHTLEHLESAGFSESSLLKQHSPYTGMNEADYLVFFRKNRRKKGVIPVYTDYKAVLKNLVIDQVIINRIRFARILAKYRLREWNN